MGLKSVRAGQACKMCFVVNTELKMGTGKVAAQVAHACLTLDREIAGKTMSHAQYRVWRLSGQTKVVLQCRSTEEMLSLYDKTRRIGVVSSLIRDAGHTQVAAGSVTVLGLFGEDSRLRDLTGHLKLL